MIHANSICQEFSAYKTAARIDIHCELAAVPFSDLIITGFLSIYVPMNLFLYVYKMSFVDSLIYSLPFVEHRGMSRCVNHRIAYSNVMKDKVFYPRTTKRYKNFIRSNYNYYKNKERRK